MKSLIKLLIIFISLSFILAIQVNASVQTGVEVKVTEYVPWANCWSPDEETWIITCTIPKGFSAIEWVFWNMIKYFTLITLLWCVLFIVINGILYSMSWLNDGLKASAKDRITKTLIWLVLLFLSWWILNTLAPWVYK